MKKITSYNEIYERCLSRIEDSELAMIPEDELENMLFGWLLQAIVRMPRCTSDLTQRNDSERTFLVELTDVEKEVLAIFMVNEWLTPQINSILLTKQFIGGKEEKWFSQASHLAELQALRDSNRADAKNLLCETSYGAANSYFQ